MEYKSDNGNCHNNILADSAQRVKGLLEGSELGLTVCNALVGEANLLGTKIEESALPKTLETIRTIYVHLIEEEVDAVFDDGDQFVYEDTGRHYEPQKDARFREFHQAWGNLAEAVKNSDLKTSLREAAIRYTMLSLGDAVLRPDVCAHSGEFTPAELASKLSEALNNKIGFCEMLDSFWNHASSMAKVLFTIAEAYSAELEDSPHP